MTRVWTCPYCSMRIESDKPGKDLSTKRRNHLNYRHKGLHRDKEDTISSRTIAIAPSKELPLQERGWTCGLCNKGLPPLPRHQREHSINTHYKTQHPRAKYNFRSALKQRWKNGSRPLKVTQFLLKPGKKEPRLSGKPWTKNVKRVMVIP